MESLASSKRQPRCILTWKTKATNCVLDQLPGWALPAVDYFNAFEMVICGAGISAFWEAVYFQKEAIFVPRQRRFENQAWRVTECQDYVFTRNGADELVEVTFGL